MTPDGVPTHPPAATAAERERLADLFARLCAAVTPTGRERAAADVALDVLRSVGLDVDEDDAATELGGDAGNLLCRIPGDPATAAAHEPLLLCAHLDTVPVGTRIEPTLDDEGVWRDALGGVLGADNKATVAAFLVVAERLARDPAPMDVELLLTVAEETQLQGIQAFDRSRLRAGVGFVIDHPSPLGGLVAAAPGHVRFEARYRGRAAHAGVAPEDGRSAVRAAARGIAALPQGRVGDGATINVGHVQGGEPVTNVVPDACLVLGELRALDEAVLADLAGTVEATLHDAAHVAGESVDLDLVLERRFAPYRHREASPAVRTARAALERIGATPRPFADHGGSDANVLNARGLPTVNLAGGNERAHEPGERIAAADLEATLELVLALLAEHGAAPQA
ncbi:M20/M25/M40 family metallo-hydrolase [Patulibacter sp. SYSU D01012]|uniref:M20/M25/M40 family metallo-hydrolase n=1 Tax=Patulibacter sp. SYSU D01012 TaxID=2817381 RepID=UPI001B311F00|nr:M20/M25/M40 family metallo-hydrolase [Patulibacter sp. SYSU D01012]